MVIIILDIYSFPHFSLLLIMKNFMGATIDGFLIVLYTSTQKGIVLIT